MEELVVQSPSDRTPIGGGKFKYSRELKLQVLTERAESIKLRDLCLKYHLPMTTITQWVQSEKATGSELGKKLCLSHTGNRSRKDAVRARRVAKAEEQVIKFPGGSEYRGVAGGAAILQSEERVVPAVPVSATDSTFVDQVFDELALRLGRQTIEIVSLKIKLQHAQKVK